MAAKLHFYEMIVMYYLLFLASVAFSKNHENPANELVTAINENRTAQKLPHLTNNRGLGCLALQYVKQCNGTCSINGTTHCQSNEQDFIEIFAPNCGIELPTFGTISAQIVACHLKYVGPSETFSSVIFREKHALSILSNRTYTEVGVGLIGDRKGFFFWCVLFSNDKVNTTFVLEDRGSGIMQKKGCFSGDIVACSRGEIAGVVWNNIFVTGILCIYMVKQFWFY